MNAIAAHLEDEHWRVRWAAVEALQNQQDLSSEIVNTITARLEDEDSDVRKAAVKALQNRQDLSLEIVDQYMESLYRTLMKKSLLEHLYWYTADETSYIVFDIPEVPFYGQQDNFWETLQRVYKHLDIPVPNI